MKLIIIAAAALATHSTVAAAESYTFYSADGHPYCDGIEINASNGVAVGQHIYNQSGGCAFPSAFLGGVEGRLPTLGAGKWYSLAESQATGDSLPTDYTVVTYVNLRALKWRMALESTNENIPFEIVFGGVLQKGAPSASANSGSSTTILAAAKRRLSTIIR